MSLWYQTGGRMTEWGDIPMLPTTWVVTDETEPHDDPELVDVTTLPDDVPDGEVDTNDGE